VIKWLRKKFLKVVQFLGCVMILAGVSTKEIIILQQRKQINALLITDFSLRRKR
jgi:hypothetical protein